jgi:predicted HNH restriction endonuclease
MNEATQKIIDKINDVITRKDVQPGYPDANGNTNVTWCNRGANYIATELGFDMTPFLEPRGIDWTNANMMYQNALNRAKEVYGKEAQEIANNGGLVLAACFNSNGPGHVAIVCPADEEYDDSLGPRVGESGARCRITHSKNAFEKWGYKARFFVIPKKEG